MIANSVAFIVTFVVDRFLNKEGFKLSKEDFFSVNIVRGNRRIESCSLWIIYLCLFKRYTQYFEKIVNV